MHLTINSIQFDEMSGNKQYAIGDSLLVVETKLWQPCDTDDLILQLALLEK